MSAARYVTAFTAAGATLVLAAALAGTPQPRTLAPRLQATVRDTSLHRLDFLRLTRDQAGRLFMTLPRLGVLVYAGRGEPGWLHTASGTRAPGGDLSWVGDTLAVSGWQSWNLYDSGGTSLACRRFGDMHNEFAVQVFATYPLPGGRVVGELTPPWAGQGIETRLVVSRDQRVLRTLARRSPDPADIDVPFPRGGGNWSVGSPFRTNTIWSVADNGRGAMVVEQEPASQAGLQRVRVRRVALDGRSAFDVVLRIPALPVTEAGRERQIAEWARNDISRALGSTVAPNDAAVLDAYRKHVPFPRYHPPVARVVAGADGSAWLRLSTNGDTAVWVRLDRFGRERGRVALPESFREAYADAAGLWGFQPGAPGETRVLVVTDGAPPFRPFVIDPPPETLGESLRLGACGD